ncbi:MAG: hypothetical protein ACRCYS_11545 [Beijerinckiaceae bacterium]
MKIPGWPPRDWRKLLAMVLLSGGGMAITVVLWRLITLVADRSVNDPWPLAYGLYGSLGLIGLVLVSLGWTLGKTQVSGGVGPANFNLSGGESDKEDMKGE